MDEKTEEIVIKKKRHWAFATWLGFAIIVDVFSLASMIFARDFLKQASPDTPNWVFAVGPIFCVIQLACLIALSQWKRWGFWLQIPFAILAFAVNVFFVHASLGSSLLGLTGPLVMFGFLKVGKENQGWKQLA